MTIKVTPCTTPHCGMDISHDGPCVGPHTLGGKAVEPEERIEPCLATITTLGPGGPAVHWCQRAAGHGQAPCGQPDCWLDGGAVRCCDNSTHRDPEVDWSDHAHGSVAHEDAEPFEFPTELEAP